MARPFEVMNWAQVPPAGGMISHQVGKPATKTVTTSEGKVLQESKKPLPRAKTFEEFYQRVSADFRDRMEAVLGDLKASFVIPEKYESGHSLRDIRFAEEITFDDDIRQLLLLVLQAESIDGKIPDVPEYVLQGLLILSKEKNLHRLRIFGVLNRIGLTIDGRSLPRWPKKRKAGSSPRGW